MADEMKDKEAAPFSTAAKDHGIEDRAGLHESGLGHRGKSFTPGLTEVPNSKVPDGEHSHVVGPQQNACDPVRAGLATDFDPATMQESRVISRTGEVGSGPHIDGPPSEVNDGTAEPAPEDEETTSGPQRKAGKKPSEGG